MPVCQTVVDIDFLDLNELKPFFYMTPTDVKEVLIKAIKTACASYTSIQDKKSNLTGIVPVMEKIGMDMSK